MPSDKQTLIDKIQALPAERIAEVEDFVDFITSKGRRLEALWKRSTGYWRLRRLWKQREGRA
jgi:hypothetical protein